MTSERRRKIREELALAVIQQEEQEFPLEESVKRLVDNQALKQENLTVKVANKFSLAYGAFGVSALLLTMFLWSYSPAVKEIASFSEAADSYSLIIAEVFGSLFFIALGVSLVSFLFNTIILTKFPLKRTFYRLMKSIERTQKKRKGPITEMSISLSDSHLFYSAASYWWVEYYGNEDKIGMKKKIIFASVGNFIFFILGVQIINHSVTQLNIFG